MAPNRKKKKPANNPARGFATTSSASKVKVSDDAPSDTDNLVSATEGADLETTNDQNGHKEIPDKDLSELSPEELEAQLEESELQLLVEKYRPKSTKDSARYVSKLQTERRVLRGQSEQLPTSVWFSQGLLDFVLGHGELHSGNSPNPTRTTPSLPSLAVEDLTIKIWTLRRTLSDLGFMSDRIQEAIIHLLKDHGLLDRANANTNKEALWGLNECLEWLAAACDLEEMPDYDSHITPKIAQLEREAALQKENMALGTVNYHQSCT